MSNIPFSAMTANEHLLAGMAWELHYALGNLYINIKSNAIPEDLSNIDRLMERSYTLLKKIDKGGEHDKTG